MHTSPMEIKDASEVDELRPVAEPRCTAMNALTAEEVARMLALPDGDSEPDTEKRQCEFEAHGPEVPHAFSVQSQSDGGEGIAWWLRWNEAGLRELKVEPDCPKLDGEELSCLLVIDHPGACDDYEEDDGGDEWTVGYIHDEEMGWLWEVRRGNRLFSDTDDFSREQVTEAQAWATEVVDDWDETVTEWLPEEGASERWKAKVS